MHGSAWLSRVRKSFSFIIPLSPSLFEGSCGRLIRFDKCFGESFEFYVTTLQVTGRYLLSPVMGMV